MAATTTHDLTINGVGYLVKPGTYRKRSAPLMGARFTSGNPDYSELGPLQHWVQSCWIGGMGQEHWTDDAMFDEAVGVDSSVHDRLALTRDLATGGTGYALDGLKIQREFVVYNNNLYCFGHNTTGDGKVYKYTTSTNTWSLFRTVTGKLIRAASQWGKRLMLGSTADHLHSYDGSTWNSVPFPTGETATVYSMKAFKDRLYVSFTNGKVYRLKPNFEWDGTTVFFDMPDAGYIVDFEVHLGFLYMLSSTGIIYRTDGNNTGEVWRADPGALGRAMRSYDGRLFVTLAEMDDGGIVSEGAIYQLSGSAMTELKRWGKIGKQVLPSMHMMTFGGRLFYGAGGLFGMQNGFGIAVYDAAEDAHSIFASNKDTTTYADVSGNGYGWSVDDIIVFGQKMFLAVRDHGVFVTPFTFRDYALGRDNARYDVSASSYGSGWLTSSEYNAGSPGLLKLWNSIEVDYELPAAGSYIAVDYSLDDGRTWNNSGIYLPYVSAGRKRARAYLSDKRSSSFKWRLRMTSTSTAATPVVYSVNVAYLPLQDPQFQWEFTVVISETQQLLDKTVVSVVTDTVIANLEDLYRANGPVTLVDVDGTTWTSAILITDMAEFVYATGDLLEAEIHLTLLELLEA